MRKIAKVIACAILTVSVFALVAGCSVNARQTGSTEPIVRSSTSSANAAVQTTDINGTPLFEFLADTVPQDNGYLKLSSNIPSSDIKSITCYKDEQGTLVVDDPDLVNELYSALAMISVDGEYAGSEMATDSASSYTFDLRSGEKSIVNFDFRKLVVGGKYYEISNAKPLTNVLVDIDLSNQLKEMGD